SAQMDVHQLRLRLLLRRRSQAPHRNADRATRISSQCSDGIGRGLRLSRLAYPAGAAFPSAQAVVRDPPLWRGGTTAPHPPSHRSQLDAGQDLRRGRDRCRHGESTMILEKLHRDLRYHYWANQETLGSLQLAIAPPEKAIARMAHIVGADSLWLDRIEGKT